MELIDTHAHIYLAEFDADRKEMLERATASGTGKIIMPAIDSQTHEAMLQAEDAQCLAMMGLHPCSVKENYKEELDIVSRYLGGRKFMAVGEIGLDFYWDRTFTEQQYQAFEQQVAWALSYDLPIVIHSRNATDECIEVVRRYPGVRGVFHCFSGNELQARQLVDLGFYLGIGGVVTYKNAGLDRVLSSVGIGQVVLETDAPYLSPVPFRGKRNECSYIRYVADKIAAILNITTEEVAATTTKNAINLFRLSHKA